MKTLAPHAGDTVFRVKHNTSYIFLRQYRTPHHTNTNLYCNLHHLHFFLCSGWIDFNKFNLSLYTEDTIRSVFCHLWICFGREPEPLSEPALPSGLWELRWAAVWKRLYSCQVSWHLSPRHTQLRGERIIEKGWTFLLREMGYVTKGKFRWDGLSVRHVVVSAVSVSSGLRTETWNTSHNAGHLTD